MAPLSITECNNFMVDEDYDIGEICADTIPTTNCKSCMKHQRNNHSNHQQPKPKKTVKFSQCLEVYETISIKDYSFEEKINTFMTIEDIERIRFDINRTIRQMRWGQIPNNNEMYFRGLESEVGQRKLERLEMIELTMFAIQEQQIENDGRVDETWINEIYRKITNKSAVSAQKAASWDNAQTLCNYESRFAK
jgi:hypothetical protein